MYTVYGKCKYILENGTCGGYVTGGFVRPYFVHVASTSDPSKWSDVAYAIDGPNEGYYSFDIEDAILLGYIDPNYKKTTDKFYIAYYWNINNPTDSSKDSTNITHAALVEHTMMSGDFYEVNVTLLPVRSPLFDTHAFPSINLLTKASYSMSETSHLNLALEAPSACGTLWQMPVYQRRTHNSIIIFDAYTQTNTIYNWGDGTSNSKSLNTNDSHTFNTAGTYNLSIQLNTGWNSDTILSQSVTVKYNEPSIDFNWTPTQTNSGQIKGQELITFHNLSTDLDGRTDTVYKYDWIITDTLYAGGDNTVNALNVNKINTPTHSFTSPGTKDVTLKCHWNDGFSDYTKEVTKQIVIYPFDVVPEFTWDKTPKNRSELVTFTPGCTGDTSKISSYDWIITDNYPAPDAINKLYTFSSIETSKFGEGSPNNAVSVDNTRNIVGSNTPSVRFHSPDIKNITMTVHYNNGWVSITENVQHQITPQTYTLTPVIGCSNTTPTGRGVGVSFTNTTVDANSVGYDVDWMVNDFYMACNLSNPSFGVITDNDEIHLFSSWGFTFSHQFQNNSPNTIDFVIRYDNGWQRKEKTTSITVTPKVFTAITPNFTWSPNIPVGRDDEVTFTNTSVDTNNLCRGIDWSIHDTWVGCGTPLNPSHPGSASDNTSVYSKILKSVTPKKKFQSSGVKAVDFKYYYDDGFCEQYVTLTKSITVNAYTAPVADITWSPTTPVGRDDTVTFTNATVDINNRHTASSWIISDAWVSCTVPLNPSHPGTASDNSNTYSRQAKTFKPVKNYQSSGSKSVSLEYFYDDGFCERSVSTTEQLTVNTFLALVPDISWTPTSPQGRNVTVTFSNITSDTNNRTRAVDWMIEDSFDTCNLDNPTPGIEKDNTVTLIRQTKTFTPTHKFQKADVHDIFMRVYYDDGFCEKYADTTEFLTSTVQPAPVPSFSWTPTTPKGRSDLVTITNTTSDLLGTCRYITWTLEDAFSACNLSNPTPGVEKDNTSVFTRVTKTFTPTHAYQKDSQHNINMLYYYDDGYCERTVTLTKSITPTTFSAPTPNFTWTPDTPSSRDDTVTFTNATVDTNNRSICITWNIYDTFGTNNPSNPQYGVSEVNNDAIFARVLPSVRPTHNFQKYEQKSARLTCFYDDGFCERNISILKYIELNKFYLTASFNTSPLPSSNDEFIGKSSINFINTTSDANNRTISVDWMWNDRDGLSSNASHIANRTTQNKNTVQPYTFQYVSRKPFCSVDHSTVSNKNKTVQLTVKYDDGWDNKIITSAAHDFESIPNEISSSISHINTVDSGLVVWGRENIKFTHTIVDPYNAVLNMTSDWSFQDSVVSTILNQDKAFEPVRSFNSAGVKDITVDVDFNDGWDNIYTHRETYEVTAIPYTVPTIDFSWSPLHPTVLDNIEFTQDNNDSRTKGPIQFVQFDAYNNGTIENVDTVGNGSNIVSSFSKSSKFYYKFSNKQNNVDLSIIATYSDGWDNQTTTITKNMSMSNIPPISSYVTHSEGICVPSYVWTATSVDLDDAESELVYEWILTKQNGSTWDEVKRGSLKTFSYPFQYEGVYSLQLTTSDDSASHHTIEDTFSVAFEPCGGAVISKMSGMIEIESNVWQLIAIPIEFGFWDTVQNKLVHDNATKATIENYVLAQLSYKYGKPARDLVEVANAYYGDENEFRSYVPGHTPASSKDNFPLVYSDVDPRGGITYSEITGFWIKSKHNVNMILKWGSDT